MGRKRVVAIDVGDREGADTVARLTRRDVLPHSASER